MKLALTERAVYFTKLLRSRGKKREDVLKILSQPKFNISEAELSAAILSIFGPIPEKKDEKASATMAMMDKKADHLEKLIPELVALGWTETEGSEPKLRLLKSPEGPGLITIKETAVKIWSGDVEMLEILPAEITSNDKQTLADMKDYLKREKWLVRSISPGLLAFPPEGKELHADVLKQAKYDTIKKEIMKTHKVEVEKLVQELIRTYESTKRLNLMPVSKEFVTKNYPGKHPGYLAGMMSLLSEEMNKEWPRKKRKVPQPTPAAVASLHRIAEKADRLSGGEGYLTEDSLHDMAEDIRSEGGGQSPDISFANKDEQPRSAAEKLAIAWLSQTASGV